MEKYSQFRDKGSSIAPFLPISAAPAGLYGPAYLTLFIIRLPFFIAALLSYFIILQWLPLGPLPKKVFLWTIMAVPGIWWIDLRVDGVKKGSIARHSTRLPQPGSVIAASSTSPIDALYLAAIFDPIFTASYPTTRKVERLSLLGAILRAFLPPQLDPPRSAKLVDLRQLVEENPSRIITVFPECTTSNGKGILRFSKSLLSVPNKRRVYPINLKYAPGDITTPIPWGYMTFLWNLLSRPTHGINVRIAEFIEAREAEILPTFEVADDSANGVDDDDDEEEDEEEQQRKKDEEHFGSVVDKRILESVGESLARIGRAKRVDLGVREKVHFMAKWNSR